MKLITSQTCDTQGSIQLNSNVVSLFNEQNTREGSEAGNGPHGSIVWSQPGSEGHTSAAAIWASSCSPCAVSAQTRALSSACRPVSNVDPQLLRMPGGNGVVGLRMALLIISQPTFRPPGKSSLRLALRVMQICCKAAQGATCAMPQR